MKKILYCLMLAVMLTACGGGKNGGEEKVYKVGDVITIDGQTGIVFDISSNGKHGKAISIANTSCDWGSAKTWCGSLGEAWRLPDCGELMLVQNNKEAINAAAKASGNRKMSSGGQYYWTSVQLEGEHDDHAWAVSLHSGKTFAYSHTYPQSVRAVAEF